jgi:hypothetical protein
MSNNFRKTYFGSNYKPQTSDPSNPIDGDLYFSDGTVRPSGFWQYKDGSWRRFGSGSGELNFYENGDADNNASTANFSTGNNSLFDGGGSLAGTFSISTAGADQINGTKVFKYVESATAVNNTNDYIASELIDIPQGYRGQLLALKLKYKTNKTNGYIKFVVKDATNGDILTNGSEILEQFFNADNTAKGFSLSFFCPSNCSQIKIGPQIITGEVSKYLIWDDAVVTPNLISIVDLGNDTDWLPYTPTTAGLGTLSNSLFQWRRVGSDMLIRGNSTTGTTTATIMTISMPSGYIIDNSKLTTSQSNRLGDIQRMSVAAVPIYQYAYLIFADGSDSSNLYVSDASASTTALTKSTGSHGFTSGDSFSFFAIVPIKNWSSVSANIIAYNEKNATNSQITIQNATGYGATNTLIRTFGSVLVNQGGAITYVPSATLGDSFVINQTGLYYLAFTDGTITGTGSSFGISINTTTVGTGILTIAPAERIALATNDPVANHYSCANTPYQLNEGDVIRPHSNGAAADGTADVQFTISYLGVPGLLGIPNNIPRSCFLSDVKAANTSGGTFTSGAWQTRTLNTTGGDTSFLTLSSNQFILQPGTYNIHSSAPAYLTGRHISKLRNITDSSDALTGSSSYSNGDTSNMITIIDGQITITVPKTYEIQHSAQTTSSTNGFGVAANLGVSETYTQVRIEKVA